VEVIFMSTVMRKRRIVNQNSIDNKYIPGSFRPREAESLGEDFYVYILNFDNGSYYIGNSRELKDRLLEIRNDSNISGFGKEPKLQYFEIHQNRQSAMLREAEIKEIYKNNNREISRMIAGFHELVGELDFSE
jgi:predicted GIY-YIG superfamily endonuclease